MKKEMTLETNDEAVDLSRRSMMSRLGLVASVAIAAPVLMTMSTSALAQHKDKKYKAKCNDNDRVNENANEHARQATSCGDWSSPPTEDGSSW